MESPTAWLLKRTAAWSRRDFFSFSALAGVAAACGLDGVAEAAAAEAASATYQDNVYTRLLGVRPVIGAFETLTQFGNSKMSAAVQQAMAEAQEFFVDMDDLNRAAGTRIAEVMKAEAAMVTSCSYGAMMLGAAACLTGSDHDKIIYAFTNPTLVPGSLKDGEEVLMAKRLRQFSLNDARRPRPSAAPAVFDARDEGAF